MSGTPETLPASEYPQNKPEGEYDVKPWGRTMPLHVDPASTWHEGMITMAVMQFDPRTADRVGDITETWSVSDLRRNKTALETELALVNAKLAYIDEALLEEQTRVAELAVVQAQAAADAALANAQAAAENAAVAMDKSDTLTNK